jgi:hypothetical protein
MSTSLASFSHSNSGNASQRNNASATRSQSQQQPAAKGNFKLGQAFEGEGQKGKKKGKWLSTAKCALL